MEIIVRLLSMLLSASLMLSASVTALGAPAGAAVPTASAALEAAPGLESEAVSSDDEPGLEVDEEEGPATFTNETDQPEAAANAAAATGEIKATLRLDHTQALEALQNHAVRATLSAGGQAVGSVNLWDGSVQAVGRSPASIQLKNADGGEDASGWPRYITLTIRDLPQGNYTLAFSGLGYKAFSCPATLQGHSQHLVLGTGDATFTLGDFNGDGKVDDTDRSMLSQRLATGDPAQLPTYDLDGDGAVGLADLVYVTRNIGAQGDAQVYSTAVLAPPVDMAALQSGGAVATSGALADIFRDNGLGVTLSAAGTSLQLPISFGSTPVEMEQIAITTPEDSGFETGQALVELADGSTRTLPIDAAAPAGVLPTTRTQGLRTITLDLGSRVAVKKITITVNKTEEGFVSIETIQFLQDIVPENPTAPNRQVKGLTAAAGHEKVSLKWREVPNVTGYKVEYWPDGSESARQSRTTTLPSLQVAGLDNLKKYWFQVTPTAPGWEGDPCEAVSATPQPAQKPAAPDMVTVTELEGALGISWKQAKSATYYEVYYKEKNSSGDYRQVGGSLSATSASISSLKNGTAYLVYVVAGNDVGKSGPSRISEGTPKAVAYDPPAGLPTSGLLDSSRIQGIRLAAPSNYAKNEYTADKPFDPANMIDGDYRTHWTAANWYGNEHVITTFKEPVNLQAVLWSPRLDGNYPKYLRAYSVQVWYEGEDLAGPGHLLTPDPARGGQDLNGGTAGGDVHTWPNIPNKSTIPTMKFAILPFGPARDVVQISVAVEQDAYNLVSCSELHFMEYDPSHCLPDEIGALFSNDLHTQLRSGVTAQAVAQLRARLNSDERFYYLDTNTLKDELDLAEELLKGSTTGVVVDGVKARSASADNQKYRQSGSELQPLGVAAKANQEVTVYASGIPSGGTLKVYASQYNAEASTWRSEIGALQNGRNTLLVPKIGSQSTDRGGSLYFTYTGTDPHLVKMHVRRATDVPVLELQDWYSLSEAARKKAINDYVTELGAYITKAGITEGNKGTNCLNVTEISTPTMLLSLPALAVKNSAPANALADRLYQSVLAWEDVAAICNTTQGIDKTYQQNDMQTRQNIRCMQMFSGAFMYATGNHIGVGYASCAGLCGGAPIAKLPAGATGNSLFGWGIAHEIGHNMDKLGKAEITNNIYALMVQTYDGRQGTLPSRLETSGKYPAIFNKAAQGLPGASNDVFVQLGMYWQLHLAYDDQAPLDFYNQFFKAWKAGTYTAGLSGLSYDEQVALTAAGVAGKDLTEFFTRWGMSLSESVKAKLQAYPAETRAIWYLNDQSRRDRLAGVGAPTGSFTATAGLKPGSDTEIVVSITPPAASHIQGYEILRDGRPIAFVPHTDGGVSYTDHIGSGNHLAFTYTVKAYSTLGSQVGSASAGQVRVAYDKTVPASDYTISRSGTTVTFTLKSETSISGLKITGSSRPASGAYTVTVTQADGQAAKAKEGAFSAGNQAADDKNCYLTYFNKPGAASTDARIWTYDAKTVTVTGVPASVASSDIQLISYAGDDVALLEDEGGFMGRLAAPYRYGDGAGEVVPAGTLVILGTYRGDPVFNTLRVKGKFTKTQAIVAGNGAEQVTITEEVRDLDGYTLMLADIPEDKQVSDISNGLFLFVPNVQREAELQDATHCDGVNLLPSQIMVEMTRKDQATGGGGQRVTAQTLWANSPGGDDLPTIVLN